MGTRNLTCVFLDGEYKVAQYGQWDGYPSGQGATVLKFIHLLNSSPQGFELFTNKVRQVKDYTSEELQGKPYEHLTRNHGAEILNTILLSDIKPIKLGPISHEIEFVKDSVFCEWAYVIDLDKATFEIYTGFNATKLEPSDRFYSFQNENDCLREKLENNIYYPIKMIKSYKLSEVPVLEVFINELEPSND